MSSGGWTSLGYIFSIVSVELLSAVAWPGACDDRVMQIAFGLGVLLSVTGMVARWIAHRRDGERINRLEE